MENRKKNDYLVINDSKERCLLSQSERDYQRKDLAGHSGSSATTARAGEMSCGALAEEKNESEERKKEGGKKRGEKATLLPCSLLMLASITVQ